MICATRNIIIFNRRYDPHERRDTYVPTKISGVSIYDQRQSSDSGGFHSERESYQIRIPKNSEFEAGKSYLQEAHYDNATNVDGFWTIHNEDLIIITDASAPETRTYTMQEVKTLAEQIGYNREAIHVVSYADNTLRGSEVVKHWRIGGA